MICKAKGASQSESWQTQKFNVTHQILPALPAFQEHCSKPRLDWFLEAHIIGMNSMILYCSSHKHQHSSHWIKRSHMLIPEPIAEGLSLLVNPVAFYIRIHESLPFHVYGALGGRGLSLSSQCINLFHIACLKSEKFKIFTKNDCIHIWVLFP